MGEHGNFHDWGFVALQLEEEYRRQRSPIDWESVRNDNNNVQSKRERVNSVYYNYSISLIM
jgi:hypothetical protein